MVKIFSEKKNSTENENSENGIDQKVILWSIDGIGKSI